MLKQLTTEEGLSEIKCFDAFQDSKGYIWIGTSAGANKYDGRDVMKFDRSNGLLCDHIYSFHEDSQQRIWVNNLNGEPIYIKDNVVHNRYTDPHLEKLKGQSDYIGWVEDEFQRIWFGHEEGYFNILDGDTIIKIVLPESRYSEKYITYCLREYENDIILGSSTSIKSIDTETFETIWEFPLIEKIVFTRSVIHKDKLYLLDLKDTYVFDLITRELKELTRKDGNPPIFDCRVLYDEVLISTAEGISVVRDSFIENYNLHSTLDSISITAVQEDQYGDLWVASRRNGLFSYYDSDVEKSKFSDYCNIIYIKELTNDSLFIVQDDWTINLIVNDKFQWKKSLVKKDENKFHNIFYKDGELWGIDKYYIHMDIEGDYKTFNNYSREVYYDEESKAYYWIGTKGFTYLNDINEILDYKDMHELIKDSTGVYHSFLMNNPYKLEVDANLDFWIGGEEGLFYFHNDQMEKLDYQEIDGSITDIILKDNHLIGVNYGKGLFDLDLESREIEFLTHEDGLPANHFTQLVMNGNDIWLSHATGICLVKKDESGLRLVKNFGREHGIPRGKITLLKIIDDVCHFVINKHAHSIKTELVVKDTIEVKMDTSAISFFTDESRTITFDCINFQFADKIQYEYRLLPVDTIWQETNDEKIELEYLASGDYDLEIRASHPFNLNTPIQRKSIIVEERWYNENYFKWSVYLICGLLLFFLVKIKALSFNSANFKHWVGEKIKKYFVKDEPKSFNIKDIHGVVHLLNLNEIKFIKSSGNYLEYHTEEKKYVSRMTMSNAVEKFKAWTDFQRVHRSYMVNFNMIDAVDHRVLKVGNSDIPFTDRYRNVIEEKLQL